MLRLCISHYLSQSVPGGTSLFELAGKEISKNLIVGFGLNSVLSDLSSYVGINLIETPTPQIEGMWSSSHLEKRLHFSLVHLATFDSEEGAPDPADGDVEVYLENFCEWQARSD